MGEIETRPFHLLIVLSWACYLTSINLSIFIWTMRMIQVPSHRVTMSVKIENVWLNNVLVNATDLTVCPTNSYVEALNG